MRNQFIAIHNLIDPATGESYKAGNLKQAHNIPIGTLVEIDFNQWHGEGACWNIRARLWVTQHARDCDGTPLYSVSEYRTPGLHEFHGFEEDALAPVDITGRIQTGWDLPDWYRDEN